MSSLFSLRSWWVLTVLLFLWSIVLPGLVALREGLFTDQQVTARVRQYPEFAQQTEEAEREKQLLDEVERRLHTAAGNDLRVGDFANLLAARRDLRNETATLPKKQTSGFFTNSTILIFFI